MWRRYGDAAYGLVVLAAFTVEAAGLAFLLWAFALRRLDVSDGLVDLERGLLGAVAGTALMVLVVTAYTLAYQAASDARQGSRRRATRLWHEVWAAVAAGAEPPPGRLGDAAVEALLDVRREVTGAAAQRLRAVIEANPVVDDLVAAAGARGRGRGHLARRLEALDLVGRAGTTTGLPALARLCDDPEPAVRVMALRALARSAAQVDEARHRDAAAALVLDVVAETDLPPGAVEEALLLLGPVAPPTLTRLIAAGGPHLVPALDAAGRLRLVGLAEAVGRRVASADPDVRAAALRSLALMGVVPDGAVPLVVAAAGAGEAEVRTHAARAAALLPVSDGVPVLAGLLQDGSWWVRRSAAWSLSGLGGTGTNALRAIARTTNDRYARHMAAHVLVDGAALDPAGGLALRGA